MIPAPYDAGWIPPTEQLARHPERAVLAATDHLLQVLVHALVAAWPELHDPDLPDAPDALRQAARLIHATDYLHALLRGYDEALVVAAAAAAASAHRDF